MARYMPYADMDKMMSLSKRRGFMFQSSEIYGGLGSTWDYGPLGVELKRNVKEAWWRSVITERDDMVGLDAAILMHPKVWEASGHVENFSDPLVECKKCNSRFRQDHLLEETGVDPESPEAEAALKALRCPNCGNIIGVTMLDGTVVSKRDRRVIGIVRGDITCERCQYVIVVDSRAAAVVR